MDFIKLAQRADAVLGILFLVVALVLFSKGSYIWGGAALLSSAASLASAKYVPARWLARRMMLARLK
ncbi:hypothetical protein [Burkholderia ubonensis]|uniref:hypothetical protein n=1 Tax=Burkholderia ubonensis TaxID=101571 RepID=UPI000755F9B8|nr:hypothetical protein [Burkholderia ubonensis]KVP16989.1 hypothetical protein WJ84_01570 [Burkholderia ubonensis]KVP39884.1 hypothetical protein WJ87_06790 [Burkholderia ubonensis]